MNIFTLKMFTKLQYTMSKVNNMRLNKMKESVIKSGILKSPETELLLPDNICPECGFDIHDTDTDFHTNIMDIYNETRFRKYYGKMITFKCPECGCEFRREMYTDYDSYVLRTLKTKITTGTLCLIFGIIVVILGCVALTIGIDSRCLNEGMSVVLCIIGILMIIGGAGLLIYGAFSD